MSRDSFLNLHIRGYPLCCPLHTVVLNFLDKGSDLSNWLLPSLLFSSTPDSLGPVAWDGHTSSSMYVIWICFLMYWYRYSRTVRVLRGLPSLASGETINGSSREGRLDLPGHLSIVANKSNSLSYTLYTSIKCTYELHHLHLSLSHCCTWDKIRPISFLTPVFWHL